MKSLLALKQHLQSTYNIQFQSDAYLEEAFTHSSFANEQKRGKFPHNERIEFLGDAVLELWISSWLFQHLPQYSEGHLTRLRAQIVCEESLSQLAMECHFDQYIRLGKGEWLSGGHMRPALLCDLFEAFIGALYLDQGLEEVAHFLSQVILPKIQDGRYLLIQDFKTMLQELLQQDGPIQIRYQLLQEEGPSHDKHFTVQVEIGGQGYGLGQGKSKKLAEQEAAKVTLQEWPAKELRHAVRKN